MPESNIIAIFNTLIAIGGVLVGSGIAWGTLKAWRTSTADRLTKLETKLESDVSGIVGTVSRASPFVWRGECTSAMREVEIQTRAINEHLEKQDWMIAGLQNWARHEMEKAKMPVTEINSILNGRHK